MIESSIHSKICCGRYNFPSSVVLLRRYLPKLVINGVRPISFRFIAFEMNAAAGF